MKRNLNKQNELSVVQPGSESFVQIFSNLSHLYVHLLQVRISKFPCFKAITVGHRVKQLIIKTDRVKLLNLGRKKKLIGIRQVIPHDKVSQQKVVTHPLQITAKRQSSKIICTSLISKIVRRLFSVLPFCIDFLFSFLATREESFRIIQNGSTTHFQYSQNFKLF